MGTVELQAMTEFLEHTHTLERRKRRKKAQFGGFDEVMTFRYVCSCGFATSWNDDPETSKRIAEKHAIPGQLSMVVEG